MEPFEVIIGSKDCRQLRFFRIFDCHGLAIYQKLLFSTEKVSPRECILEWYKFKSTFGKLSVDKNKLEPGPAISDSRALSS